MPYEPKELFNNNGPCAPLVSLLRHLVFEIKKTPSYLLSGGRVPREGGAAVLVPNGQGFVRRDLPKPAGEAPAESAFRVGRHGKAHDW